MDFKFERRNVGDGWQAIIENLHKDLVELDPNYQVAQIKEKFGGLRYYIEISEGVDGETQRKMYALTYAAEEESLKTCEKCGAPGKPSTVRSWIKTLCEDHDEKRNAVRETAAERVVDKVYEMPTDEVTAKLSQLREMTPAESVRAQDAEREARAQRLAAQPRTAGQPTTDGGMEL